MTLALRKGEIRPHTIAPIVPAAKLLSWLHREHALPALWCTCSYGRETNCRQLGWQPAPPTTWACGHFRQTSQQYREQTLLVYPQQAKWVIATSWAEGNHGSVTIGVQAIHIGKTPRVPGSGGGGGGGYAIRHHSTSSTQCHEFQDQKMYLTYLIYRNTEH